MNPILMWFACAVLGMATTMLTAILGLGAALIALLLAIPLVLRGDPLAVISGLMIGFGGLWLFLLASQVGSGGSRSDTESWILIGSVPVAIGGVAMLCRLARTFRSRVTLRDAD